MRQLRPLTTDTDQFTGNPASSIRLVEYGDYQCPHCGHAHLLVKKLIAEKGTDFVFVFRNFPLQEIHPLAFMAATAAEAAGKQDRFWEMHDLILENQKRLLARRFPEFAGSIGLDQEKFMLDMNSAAISGKINQDFESGVRSGVNGTPAFYINGELLSYDTTYNSLLTAIENAK